MLLLNKNNIVENGEKMREMILDWQNCTKKSPSKIRSFIG
jgi:hypothetical protein